MSYRAQISSEFSYALQRSKTLCSIYDYVQKSSPAALDATDMLRASIVLGVSALDHLLHQLIRMEIEHRLINSIPIFGVNVPSGLIGLDINVAMKGAGTHIYEVNSYKSFVSPSKLAEGLRCVLEKPWPSIAEHFGDSFDAIKLQLGLIVNIRNRIAHEGDLIPQSVEPESYPIDRSDVGDALVFLGRLGDATISAVISERTKL